MFKTNKWTFFSFELQIMGPAENWEMFLIITHFIKELLRKSSQSRHKVVPFMAYTISPLFLVCSEVFRTVLPLSLKIKLLSKMHNFAVFHDLLTI